MPETETLILIAILFSIWVYPAIFTHLYAYHKLDKAKKQKQDPPAAERSTL